MNAVGTPSSPARHPSVSVVIATRDRPQLLRRAVEAAVAQEYPGDVECVVVLDGPEDSGGVEGTESSGAALNATLPDLARRRDDRDVRVLPNHRTPGLAGARNSGIEASACELVAFCDDDDVWLPAKLRAQVDLLLTAGDPPPGARQTAPDAEPPDVVVTGINVHYEDHVVPRVPRPEDLTVTELSRRRVMEAHPSTVLVRREALLGRIGLVDERIPGSYGEDFDWLLRAAQAGRPIGVVSQPLVDVHWGAQSHFAQRWQTIVDAIDYKLEKHPVLSHSRRGHAWLLGRKAFAYAALGSRRRALATAWRCLRRSALEPRSYVATLVALRLVSAERALAMANARGRGI